MSEKKDDPPSPEIPVFVGEMQIGSAEIPIPATWLIGVIVGIIALLIAIVSFTRR